MTGPGLGAIADDLTGATDLAIGLTQSGFRTTVIVRMDELAALPESDAVIIALKTRSLPAKEAVDLSLRALQYLESIGCDRFYFKYCSTFDSTPAGNIGPVAEALLEALDEAATVIVPSFPATGRTVFQGHLFVGDELLSESPMRHHPLNPMTDSSVVRLLAAQTETAVTLVSLPTVMEGAQAVRIAMAERVSAGARLLVIDAVTEKDLCVIGEATSGFSLVTGGSGLAHGLRGPHRDGAVSVHVPTDHRITLAGSASAATTEQVAYILSHGAGQMLDTSRLRKNFEEEVAAMVRAALTIGHVPYVIHAPPHSGGIRLAESQLIETALASVATSLVDSGVQALVVAGGETSGAVAAALGVSHLVTGPVIDPGVAWSRAVRREGPDIALALKSGNFGGADIFTRAWSTP